MRQAVEKIIEILEVRPPKTGTGLICLRRKKFTADLVGENWLDVTMALSEIEGHKLLKPADYVQLVDKYFADKKSEALSDMEYFENFEEYVYWSMEQHGIVMDELGRIDDIRSSNDISILKVELHKYNEIAKEFKARVFPPNLLDDMIKKISFDTRKKKEKEIRDRLKYNPKASDAGFRTIIDQIIPVEDPKKWMHVEALKHMIWQVKKKMAGEEILDPLMLFVSGKQGQGKSSMIREIFKKPLGHFYTEQDLDDALDVRSTDTKSHHYFLLIDEMVSLGRKMVANLKKIITSSEESARILGTNSVKLVRNNLTIAATSNYELKTVIYDETGMRRFWELRFMLPKGQVIDWEKFGDIDMVELWQSVDEDRPYGYYHRSLESHKAMSAHQSESEPRSYAHLFLYFEHYLVDDTSNYTWVKASDIFKAYKEWSKERSIQNSAHNSVWFDNKLKELGVECRDFNRERAYFLNNHKDLGAEIIETDELPTNEPVKMQTEDNNKLVRADNVKKFQADANISFKEGK